MTESLVARRRERDEGVQTMETVTLSDQVKSHLLAMMTTGQLRPGDRVNEAELARRLGISRNPIREAVSQLAGRGYLLALPRRGHCMRKLRVEDVNDVFSFRICVETFAIRQAMPRMTPDELAELEGILAQMIAAAESEQISEVHRLDFMLHRRLCEMSGNRQTLRALERIETEVSLLVASVDLEHETLMQTALIHQPIVEAVCSGDTEAAAAMIEQHIRATWSDVLKVYGGGEPPQQPGAGLSTRVRRKSARRPMSNERQREFAE